MPNADTLVSRVFDNADTAVFDACESRAYWAIERLTDFDTTSSEESRLHYAINAAVDDIFQEEDI